MDKVKRNEEMERVSKVFKEYIEDSPYLEWLWSKKLGYVLMQIDMETGEIMESEVISEAENFCRLMFGEIAQDVLEPTGNEHDTYEADPLEQAEITKRLAPYIEQLPEYQYLYEKLFETP